MLALGDRLFVPSSLLLSQYFPTAPFTRIQARPRVAMYLVPAAPNSAFHLRLEAEAAPRPWHRASFARRVHHEPTVASRGPVLGANTHIMNTYTSTTCKSLRMRTYTKWPGGPLAKRFPLRSGAPTQTASTTRQAPQSASTTLFADWRPWSLTARRMARRHEPSDSEVMCNEHLRKIPRGEGTTKSRSLAPESGAPDDSERVMQTRRCGGSVDTVRGAMGESAKRADLRSEPR
jgi:hypothetical protein